MGVSISYDADSRMIFSGLSCSCSLEHSTPRQDIYVGQRLIGKVPHFIRRRGLGTRCVLVARGHQSRETLLEAGVPVMKSLREAADWVLEQQ